MSKSPGLLKSKKVSAKWNQKQSIKQFLSKFNKTFEMEMDAIDLRTMAENYPNKIIPLDDIHQAIVAVVGPKFQNRGPFNYDPSGGAVIAYTGAIPSPRMIYADWEELFLWTLFQRDVAPNHTVRIDDDFEHTAVIVPNAIKFTIDGKVYYCVWDGHHTLQVCRLQGYKKFPLWVIDIDQVPEAVIVAAGFPATEAGRIDYGIWLAGSNMIRINSKNKRKLNPYDEFMIKLECKDSDTMAIYNILVKNGCVPKRHATMAGAFTQIKSGEECYELEDKHGNKGIYFDRALEFHRKAWPKSPLVLEVFRPLSYLYHMASTQKGTLDAKFDVELTALLKKKYGDPESVQLKIKESYEQAITNGLGHGNYLDTHKTQVLNGLINLYNDNVGRVALPAADYVWKV
jgi:hypothetical protein